MNDALDRVWIDAAARLGIPVARGGDAYVHWDTRRLWIASDEHLDADDTVAQLVLHEICHAAVQGKHAALRPDWGLDNTHEGDAVNEAAAVRLQAHLLGRFGLRGVLFPTTVVRAFYEALPDDAFLPADDESARLARVAATLLAEPPSGRIVREALDATRRLVDPAVHARTGLPLGRADRTCRDCAFRTPGGLCREAPRRAFVRDDDRACSRWVESLDCLACGACCRSAFSEVPVVPSDRLLRKRPELVGRDGDRLLVRRDGPRCAALAGPDGGPFHCVAYEDRPRTCRDFTRGSLNCLDARRRVGLSF